MEELKRRRDALKKKIADNEREHWIVVIDYSKRFEKISAEDLDMVLAVVKPPLTAEELKPSTRSKEVAERMMKRLKEQEEKMKMTLQRTEAEMDKLRLEDVEVMEEKAKKRKVKAFLEEVARKKREASKPKKKFQFKKRKPEGMEVKVSDKKFGPKPDLKIKIPKEREGLNLSYLHPVLGFQMRAPPRPPTAPPPAHFAKLYGRRSEEN